MICVGVQFADSSIATQWMRAMQQHSDLLKKMSMIRKKVEENEERLRRRLWHAFHDTGTEGEGAKSPSSISDIYFFTESRGTSIASTTPRSHCPNNNSMIRRTDSLVVRMRRQGLGITLALIWHLGQGLTPVTNRYVFASASVTAYGMLAVGSAIACVLMTPYLLKHRREYNPCMLHDRLLWAESLVWTGRMVTLLMASEYIEAYLFQIVELMSPIMVSGIAWIIYREPMSLVDLVIPPVTIVGAMLALPSGVASTNKNAILGLSIALISTVFQSLSLAILQYMRHYRKEVLLLTDAIPGVLVGLSLYGVRGMWLEWSQTPANAWLGLLWLAIPQMLLLNILLFFIMTIVSASVVSSMISTRLVSSLFFSWLILKEAPSSVTQYIGVAIVAISVTFFVVWKRFTFLRNAQQMVREMTSKMGQGASRRSSLVSEVR
eukprot:NODE_572_length_1597_cov_44.401809_g470_i0.p1 GENE.NODE_572_length_1597_cov_44.401809_g470_i0~~NODE_572_length_1597_cov_44.401809_g470_i0.p1  ORF type:complete len:435 (+),score=115.33 NODE_572_length_1597_cov_44.401809_g470_i0:93-1397(+)